MSGQTQLSDERSVLLERPRAMSSSELRGYLLMAASALGFATNSACVKALALAGLPALEIVLLRSILQLSLGLLGCLAHGVSPLGPTHDRRAFRWLVARGLFGAFGNACFFYAVSVMPLADATVVFFTGPVFSALFARMLLDEPYDGFDRVLSVVCLSGIVLVVQPGVLFGGDGAAGGAGMAWGAGAALVGAMSGALAYCSVRKAGHAVHAMVHVVWFGVLSLLGSSAALYVSGGGRVPGGAYEWCVAGALGAFAFLGQALLNRGLQLVPAGPGMLVRNLDVVFAFVFGVAVFGETTGVLKVAGAVVIVLCTVAMGVRKWRAMAKRRTVGQGRPRPLAAQKDSWSRYLKIKAVWLALAYVLSVSFFTCPTTPTHPVCRIESFASSTIVAPITTRLLNTETGARINSAYNAHLAPFYEKHGAPVVGGVRSFVSDTAMPVVDRAISPVTNAVHRALGPYASRATTLYDVHVRPSVSLVSNAAGHTILPMFILVRDHTVFVLDNYVVPFAKSLVNEHIVPLFVNHVEPRWRTQVRPAVSRYLRVALDYMCTSVGPSIVDGAAVAYHRMEDLGATYVLPYVKRATVRVYSAGRAYVVPPVRRAYAGTLKPYVDRVVPWEQVDRVGAVVYAFWDVATGFAEECYFMCYTIVTGDEHPAVIERMRMSQKLIADKAINDAKASATTAAAAAVTERAGQVKEFARRVSGSARQWVQVARGWVGSAVDVAKEGVATYAARMSATVEEQVSMATEAVHVLNEAVVPEDARESVAEKVTEAEPAVEMATEAVAEKASEAVSVAENVTEAVVEKATQAPLIIKKATEAVVEKATEAASADKVEQIENPIQDAKDDVASAANSVASAIKEEVVDITNDASEAATEAAEHITYVAADSIASSISKVVADTVAPAAANVAESVADAVKDLTSAAADVVPKDLSEATSAAASVVESIAEKVEEAEPIVQLTSALESLAHDTLETTDFVNVPSALEPESLATEAKTEVESFAERAAEVIYEARDAMAGIVAPEEDKAKFEELVKSAEDKVGNLEAFPSILNDIESTETTAAASVEDSSVELTTDESVSDAVPEAAVPEKPLDVSEKPVVVKKDAAADTESAVKQTLDTDITDAPAEPATPETDSSSANVDEDVRKSASNWVKDARKSISKEIAEERTRAVIQAAADDSESVESAHGPSVAIVEEEPEKAADLPEALLVETPVVQVAVDETAAPSVVDPAMSAAEKPAPAKSVEEKSAAASADNKPSVTENANPVVQAKRDGDNKSAATVNAQPESILDSLASSSSSSTKGPRKIKKTKKRVVKKTADPSVSAESTL
ncbi:hypothetical protein GGI15_001798 [Coemansia interrupta]|uniref:EamA domain-containing protein n=1 Tax=Coemansia interrupta TaxID=1126814 RepID=A0A9W8HIR7_9FUNG|nr:hypothetical protein GGI15_001798 [Coemansia interrupta]